RVTGRGPGARLTASSTSSWAGPSSTSSSTPASPGSVSPDGRASDAVRAADERRRGAHVDDREGPRSTVVLPAVDVPRPGTRLRPLPSAHGAGRAGPSPPAPAGGPTARPLRPARVGRRSFLRPRL